MSGTVPPPPPPSGGPDEATDAPAQELHPATMPTHVQQVPVQRISASTRMPPAISPASQFAQAVTPAPAAPGAPMVQSVHHGGGEPGLQQYFPEQYPSQGHTPQYPPHGYDQYSHPTNEAPVNPDQQEPERKWLSPGKIAFIALDALLIVAAIVFAVSLFGGSQDAPSDETETTTEQQSIGPEPGNGLETAGGADVAMFASPTLNITCTISSRAATCGIAQRNQQFETAPTCTGSTGYIVKVDPSGTVTQPCIATKDLPKTADAGTSVLDYGIVKKVHGFTCTSERTGMGCVADSTGTGFTIARAGIGEA